MGSLLFIYLGLLVVTITEAQNVSRIFMRKKIELKLTKYSHRAVITQHSIEGFVVIMKSVEVKMPSANVHLVRIVTP